MSNHLLSSRGSDRATAYVSSNKLIRHDGLLYAGWLDAPDKPGSWTNIRLGICDSETGALRNSFVLGQALDNHCGPALALDARGRMHAIIGAHHGPFCYRWSDNPADEQSWSSPHLLGPYDTYPALIADAEGTLHLLSRQGESIQVPHGYGTPWAAEIHWRLWYRRKKSGRDWEPPVTIAISPTSHYSHFMQSLSTGPNGALHMFFQFHYTEGDLPQHLRGKSAVYLRSDDGGDTWFNEQQGCEFPLTIRSAAAFRQCPEGGLRISNHVVDAEDRPWIFTCHAREPQGYLHRRSKTGWEVIDVGPTLGRLNLSSGHGREVSLSRSANGNIHLVIATNPDDQPSAWFGPRHELFHLVLDEKGNTLSFRQHTENDSSNASWLPALENSDWARSNSACHNNPWLIFTQDQNSVDIPTKVYLTQLQD